MGVAASELAVLPGGGDLPNIFIEVALGVAILHRNLVEHLHGLASKAALLKPKRASFMWVP
jgi:hypothetical protein